MIDTVTESSVDPVATRRAALMRLATGLIQGLLLYGLYEASEAKVWPATHKELFSALFAVAFFAPFVVLAGVSNLRLPTLAVWKAVAALIAGGLAWYAAWSVGGDAQSGPPGGAVVPAIAALVFIGHHLVEPADNERRWIARFANYFDITWKHGVQLVLALGFTGAFWILLFLASALFKLIGISAIEKLIQQELFSIPATTVMFAAAVQLTDVRATLVRGVRTVALALLAWLLPLMALIAGGFLLTLPFTGLAPLWATKSATALLLVAAALLVLLTNAAYQDGSDKPPLVLAWAARITGLLLAPIVGLAAYGLALRIGQYGLSPDRVIAAACVLVAAGYAIGYAVAAARPGPWMKTLETTNIAMAFVVVAVLLALFTPLADPRRLSVNDQVARLERGKVKAEAFDFAFLRFDAGRAGQAALQRLKASKSPEIAKQAREAIESKIRPEPDLVGQLEKVVVYPKGRALPADLLKQGADESRFLCGYSPENCAAVLLDTDGDGVEEVLLSNGGVVDVLKRGGDGAWSKVGVATRPCDQGDLVEAFKTGKASLSDPEQRRDLLVGGLRLRISPAGKACPTPDGDKVQAKNRP